MTDKGNLRQQLELAIRKTPAIDVHTHVHPLEFDSLFLSGIDDLLTYHYLIAEVFRSTDLSHAQFWRMTKLERADFIWKTLFVENTPLSEATRGIVTILNAFNLDTRAENLAEAREFFSSQDPREHLDRVLETACVSDVVMTNDPFHDQELVTWQAGIEPDARFHASLRLDTLLNDWPTAVDGLKSQGFNVSTTLNTETHLEIRRFLDKWILRMRPVYMAVSLPADFEYPADDERTQLIREVILPTAHEHNLSLALMMGVRRGVNPALRAAGDGLGKADITALERICADYPEAKFLATMLSRENQHELCVAARKFNNLMPFGCWWFLNNPSIVSEITNERLELIGPSFVPQHSDARVLEQLIYKWQHARIVITESLYETYARLLDSGRPVTSNEIVRDVSRLFAGNFSKWVDFSGSTTR
ncbi:MAG: glucuronate isomerase [Acidobacteria bacterium]|nr:MAG: glucuronate isomerase [Acidobacteriota bacterium]